MAAQFTFKRDAQAVFFLVNIFKNRELKKKARFVAGISVKTLQLILSKCWKLNYGLNCCMVSMVVERTGYETWLVSLF